MRHIGERVTDYILGELSPADMAELKSHLTQCADCKKEVVQFERTYSMLKASPDVNPPRSIVFEFDKPAANRWWKWLAPMAAAAMLLIGVALASPIQVQWKDAQLTIAFGKLPAPALTPAPAPAAERIVVERAAAEPVNYERIQKWINDEVNKKDAARVKEIQRLQGQLVYLANLQQATERNMLMTESSIQLLTMRSPSED